MSTLGHGIADYFALVPGANDSKLPDRGATADALLSGRVAERRQLRIASRTGFFELHEAESRSATSKSRSRSLCPTVSGAEFCAHLCADRKADQFPES